MSRTARQVREIVERLECAASEDNPLESLMRVVKEDGPTLRAIASYLDGRVVMCTRDGAGIVRGSAEWVEYAQQRADMRDGRDEP